MTAEDTQCGIYSFIGQRIRERRKQLKLSQAQLAELMGFSYQQMQKYEAGNSQTSISRLLQFARVLKVAPMYFYDGAKFDDTIGQGIDSVFIPKTRTQPLHILLVEDSPADVILFRKALSVSGERVDLHVIHSPEIVGDYLHHHETKYGKRFPDIAVLDISMPRIGGLQLLRHIKHNARTVALPVIVMSHSMNRKDMEEAYRNGASGYICKNVETDHYIESVENMLTYWSKTVALPVM